MTGIPSPFFIIKNSPTLIITFFEDSTQVGYFGTQLGTPKQSLDSGESNVRKQVPHGICDLMKGQGQQ